MRSRGEIESLLRMISENVPALAPDAAAALQMKSDADLSVMLDTLIGRAMQLPPEQHSMTPEVRLALFDAHTVSMRDDSSTRTEVVQLRVSKREKVLLKARAAQAGKSLSDYLRDLVA
jgi:hypothetical protein